MTDEPGEADLSSAAGATSQPTFLQSVLGWLHQSYPDGISRTDYYPLLALLKRSLTEDEVVQAAFSVLKDSDPNDPVSLEQIREAIRETAEKEATPDELNQVAGRLAMVGWPLADHS